MHMLMRGSPLLASLLLLGGCITPWNTRLPTLHPQPPVLEGRSYQLHDPFPDTLAGPDTMARPREFAEPRAEPRRTLEGQALLGMPQGGPVAPAPVPSSWQYPDSLRQ